MAEPTVAVLIDYENVGLSALPDLFDKISDVGRVIVRRAYGDWSAAKEEARDQLLELGIEAIQNFHSKGSAKNSADIRLAVDAIELLYRSPVEVFVIVSADSDFVPLVGKLRAGGKEVIGAGRQDVVSSTLVKSCDRYIYLGGDSAQLKGVKRTAPRRGKAEKLASQYSAAVQDLLLRALKASAGTDGKVVGAKLSQTMLRIDPSFDFRALSFKSFGEFLEACEGIKVSRPKGSPDVVVEVT